MNANLTTAFVRAFERVVQAEDSHLAADFRLRTPDRAFLALLREVYCQGQVLPMSQVLEDLQFAHLGALLNQVSMTEGREAARRLAALICYAEQAGVLVLTQHATRKRPIGLSLQARHRLLALLSLLMLTSVIGQGLYIAQTGEIKLTDVTPFIYFLTACLGCWNNVARDYKK